MKQSATDLCEACGKALTDADAINRDGFLVHTACGTKHADRLAKMREASDEEFRGHVRSIGTASGRTSSAAPNVSASPRLTSLPSKPHIQRESQMSNSTNLFAGLREAKTFDRGVWLKVGRYEVRVTKAIYKKTRAKGDAYILEFTIEKSDYEQSKAKAIAAFGNTPFNMADLEKTLPNQIGTTASWYQSMKDMDIGFGALKSFAASILGQKSDDPEFVEGVEDFMNKTVSEGVLNGVVIPVEVVIVKTKKDEDFSLHKWGAIIEQAA